MNFDRYLADELADHSAVAEATLDAVGHGFVTLVTAAVETIQRDGMLGPINFTHTLKRSSKE